MTQKSAPTRVTGAARESALVDAAWDQVSALLSPPGSGALGSGPAGPVAAHAGLNAIAGYQILGELQRGGQGVVYLAFQESTRRKVAVKVLKQGPFAGAAELARFEREVDLLARLRHPGIVAVHDRGVAAGCPFLVMDYVAGRTLDAYVTSAALGTRPTLALFAKICDAVHAAHLVGIIHRDLKPANIRVDDAGEPHVLDFGLAKLADPPAFSPSAGPTPDLTETGQFIGSLPWASPEQAEGRHDLTDLRTDVYSLGVLLFHMLTGELPYPRSASPRELAAHIVGTSPVRPSSVRRGIGADVETVILKCIAKDPGRRYQSAGEVARDVGNALAGRPIDAKRDSAAYVLRKMLRRHWAAGLVGAAFVLLLAGTAATTTVLYRRAAAAGVTAQERLVRAEREALKAARVGEVLGSLLTSLSPWNWVGANNARVLAATLDQAAARAAAELADEPEVRAALDEALGAGYFALENLDRAEEHLARALELRLEALGEDHGDVAVSRTRLGVLRRAQGRRDEARVLADMAIAWQLENLGEMSPDAVETLALLANLALDRGELDGAEAFARRTLAAILAVDGDAHPLLTVPYHTLGAVMMRRGSYDEAAAMFDEALRIALATLPPDHPRVADLHAELGGLYAKVQAADAAEPHLREALRIRLALFDGPHDSTALALSNLAAHLVRRGAFVEAEPAARQALDMRRALGVPDDDDTASTLLNLGGALKGLGRLDEAEAAYAEALAISRGQSDRTAATAVNNIAMLRKARGDLEGAEAADREALAIRRRLLPAGHIDTAHSLNNLGDTLLKRGDAAGAEPLLREAVANYRGALGDRHLLVGNSLGHLGRCLLARHPGGGAEAAAALLESVAIFAANDPPASPRLLRNRCGLAEALIRERRFEEAEVELLACEQAIAESDTPAAELPAVAEGFVRLYESWGKEAEAAAWRARLGAGERP